jgi:hypothetical protein
MVRLVFRPYTQIRRSICTLESLRASTRVSPGFTLHRHSSPSFGSQQICSHSNLSSENHDRSMVLLALPTPITFIAHCGFVTRVLAYMLDSLVRVSRRVGENHFVSILASHFHLSPAHGTSTVLKKRTPAEAGPLYLHSTEVPRSELMLTAPQQRAAAGRYWIPPLPFQQFQVLFTLFSKFFASFPRGTCSLSVSC